MEHARRIWWLRTDGIRAASREPGRSWSVSGTEGRSADPAFRRELGSMSMCDPGMRTVLFSSPWIRIPRSTVCR